MTQTLLLPADDKRHGTQSGYKDYRCRCGTCRLAMARAANVYKLRRAANGGRPLMVDKLGSVRRLQALMALGWPRRELARIAGYRGDAFALILNSSRRMVTIDTARRIDELFDRLSMTHGPSARTRQIAAERGWPPPLAWNDIDNPAEQPTGWHYVPADRADHLAGLDERQAGISAVCAELGIRRDSVERWCERNGMRDMYVRFMERETPYVERRNQWSA